MARELKLKPEVVRAIQAARQAGASHADLVRRFKLSKGSIATALGMPATAGAAPAPEPKRRAKAKGKGAAQKAPSFEELQDWVAQHVREARDELARLKAEDAEPTAIASAARGVTQAAQLLARVMPSPPPPAEDPNDAPDIKAAAEEGRRLFLETFGNLVRSRAM